MSKIIYSDMALIFCKTTEIITDCSFL